MLCADRSNILIPMATKILATILVLFAVNTARAGLITDQVETAVITTISSTGMETPFDTPDRSISHDDDSQMDSFDALSSASPAPGIFYETSEYVTYRALQGTLLTLNSSLPRPPILDGPIKPPRKNHDFV